MTQAPKNIEQLRLIVPTDGSSCLLLSGEFGRSPFSWQLSAGNGPVASFYWTLYSLK